VQRRERHAAPLQRAINIFAIQQAESLRSPLQLAKKSLRAFFAKLLSELQNQFLYHDFAILPLRRVI